MSATRKEGETRPLRESAPIQQPQTPARSQSTVPVYAAPEAPPAPAPLPGAFLQAALYSFLPAWLYVRYILFIGVYAGWGLPLFTALYIAGVEMLAGALRRRGSKESVFWAVCWALLSVFMVLWGAQPGGLGMWQMLAWHLFAVWYTLARCGMLAAGHSGLLVWLDALAGLLTLPFGNFFLRGRALWQGARGLARRRAQDTAAGKRRLATVLLSVALACLLCAVAWGQLAAADEHFARLGDTLFAWLDRLPRWRFGPNLLYFILSLPVGAWLYGLAAGGLRRERPPVSAQTLFDRLAPWQKLPPFTLYLTLGVLCGVYALFFAVQVHTFYAFGRAGLVSGAEVSGFAVNGFWELCRVLLLDFAVLAGVRFFGPRLLQKRPVRALSAVFCVFGLGFAALAAAKLGLYIRLYGFTPRRVISGWFLCVLAVWAVLALLWVLGARVPLGHARLGLFVFAAAFVVLAGANLQQRIVRANIDRWAAGADAELDTAVLADCGVGTWSDERDAVQNQKQALYAQWLLEAGWFEGRPAGDVRGLYAFDLDSAMAPGSHSVVVFLDGSTALQLSFADGVCTGAALAPGRAPYAGSPEAAEVF